MNNAVTTITPSERAWVLRAARFADKVRDWVREVSSWSWSDSSEPEKNGFLRISHGSEFQELEQRAEVIQIELASLGVDELKSYVLHAHSRAGSSFSAGSLGKYENLDDFTALMTATIVQALPRLSRLHGLLSQWALRFLVIRQVPRFLGKLDICNEQMHSAHAALETPHPAYATARPTLTQRTYDGMNAVLQEQVSTLAKQIDSMLDLLEGSEDTLPDVWVDAMDRLEKEYWNWIVKAQQATLNNELDAQHGRMRFDFTNSQHLQLSPSDQPPSEHIRLLAATQLSEFGDSPANPSMNIARGSAPLDEQGVSLSMAQDVARSSMSAEDTESPEKNNTTPSIGHRKNHSTVFDSVPGTLSVRTDSDSSSDVSSPLIAHAKLATKLGSPTIVDSPGPGRQSFDFLSTPTKARNWHPQKLPDTRQSWHGLPSLSFADTDQWQQTSTKLLDNPGLISQGGDESEFAESEPPMGQTRARSASTKSFEVIPHNQIRTIQIRRTQSYDTPVSPLDSASLDVGINSTPHGRAWYEDQYRSPGASNTDFEQDQVMRSKQQMVSINGNVDAHNPGNEKAMASALKEPSGNGLISPLKKRAVTMANFTKPSHKKSGSSDRLERQINSLLEQLPADLRLSSVGEAGSKTPDGARTSKPSTTRRLSIPRLLRSRTSTPSPSAALTPASDHSSSDIKGRGESGIRLYNLYEPGRSAPIKLFVRLVGETNERVMVRVGGGWADLGEYLKEYAVHHGKRSTTSDRPEVSPMPAEVASSLVDQGSATGLPFQATPIGPTSKFSSPKFSRQYTSPASFTSPPQTPPSAGPWGSELESASPNLGLAGPRSREMNISPRKRAWVEGMLRQARRTSGGAAAEQANNQGRKDSGSVGDLGRVKGVRRVFMKSRQESV